MSLSATRPPWLLKEAELETFVEKHNPSLNISRLKCDRNGCQLVDDVLAQIVSKRNLQTPSEFEMNLARIHLAVDLQNILKSWCSIGLMKTLERSELRNQFSPDLVSDYRKPVDLEQVSSVTKMEVASPQSVCSVPIPRTHNFRPQNETMDWASPAYSYVKSRDVLLMSQSNNVPPAAPRLAKRPLEVDQYQDTTKVARMDKTSFICPYYARNPETHPECANKTFPNPRKLKEHVWRWLKPFKCPTCGEGFGREKTRAIHCEQRKTKCKKAESRYEGSPEYHRDRQIEAAKSTQEMIEIFESFEKENDSSPRLDPNSTTAGNFSGYPIEERSSSPESQNDSPNNSLDASDGEIDPGAEDYMSPEHRSCSVIPHSNNHYTSQHGGANLGTSQEEIRSTSEGLSPQTLGGSNKHGRLSSCHWRQDPEVEANSLTIDFYGRGRSAPPFTTMSTNNFAQLSSSKLVPDIIITEFETEPRAMNTISRSTINTNQPRFRPLPYYYSSPTDEAGSPYLENSAEDQNGSPDSSYGTIAVESDMAGVIFGDGARSGTRLMSSEVSSQDPHYHTTVPHVSNGWGGIAPFPFKMSWKSQ